jgi:hypothetical protein
MRNFEESAMQNACFVRESLLDCWYKVWIPSACYQFNVHSTHNNVTNLIHFHFHNHIIVS